MQRITVSKLNNLPSSQMLINNEEILTAQIDGEEIFVTTSTGVLTIYGLSKMQKIAQVDLKKYSFRAKQQISVAKVNTTIAIRVQKQQVLVVFDLKNIANSFEYNRCHMRPITCLIPYDKWFVTGSQDMTIKLWEVNEGLMRNKNLVKKPSAIHLAQNSINCLKTYGSLLIAGSKDRSLNFFQKNALWLSYTFQDAVLQIFTCPASEQIIIMTANNKLYFISIISVLNKKLQIRGSLDIQWELGNKICGIEMNQQFFVLGSGVNVQFIQVNLIKSIKTQQLVEDGQNQYSINSLTFKANSFLYGIGGKGVAAIDF